MSNTPRFNSWWNSYRSGAITADQFKESVRGMELELEHALSLVKQLRELGEVYIYPSDWRCAKEGGPPPIEAFEKIDLSEGFPPV